MKRYMLAVLMIASCSPAFCAGGGHYATWKVNTHQVERHASGLHLPNKAKTPKLKTPHAPKEHAHKQKVPSKHELVLIREMELERLRSQF